MDGLEIMANPDRFLDWLQQHAAATEFAHLNVCRLNAWSVYASEALSCNASVGRAHGTLYGLATAFPSMTRSSHATEANSALRCHGLWRTLLFTTIASEAAAKRCSAELDALTAGLMEAAQSRRDRERLQRAEAQFLADVDGYPEDFIARLSPDERALIGAMELLFVSVAHHRRTVTDSQLQLFATAESPPPLPPPLPIHVFIPVPLTGSGSSDPIIDVLIAAVRSVTGYAPEPVVPQLTPGDSAHQIRLRTLDRIASCDVVIAIDNCQAQGVSFAVSEALTMCRPVIRLVFHNADQKESNVVGSGSATGLQLSFDVTEDSVADAVRLGLGMFASRIIQNAELRQSRAQTTVPGWIIAGLSEIDERWSQWMSACIEKGLGGCALTGEELQQLGVRLGISAPALLEQLLANPDTQPRRVARPKAARTKAPPVLPPTRATLSKFEFDEFDRFLVAIGTPLAQRDIFTLMSTALDRRTAERQHLAGAGRLQRVRYNRQAWGDLARTLRMIP